MARKSRDEATPAAISSRDLVKSSCLALAAWLLAKQLYVASSRCYATLSWRHRGAGTTKRLEGNTDANPLLSTEDLEERSLTGLLEGA